MTNIESVLASLTKHGVASSTKLKATIDGHILNIKADKDLDNGVLVAPNAYVEADYYTAKDSTGFKGKIVDIAANGNFIVEVVDPGDAFLVLTTPKGYITDPAYLAGENQFYNAKDELMRCYQLYKFDRFTVSAECFDTTPAKDKTVTATASTRKLHTA